MGTREKEQIDYLKTKLGFYSKSMWKDKKVSFIVSTGRTGTWFLVRFLMKFSHLIDARHEPDPDFLKLGIRYARKDISFAKVINTLKFRRQYVCHEMDQNNKTIYIESNNNLFSLVPALWKIFPEAKILHVVRDGRDFVRSVMSRGHYTEGDKIHTKKKLRLDATWFPEDSCYYRWNSMSLFEKACWEWQKKDEFIYRSILGDARAQTVTFEEIFNPDNHGEVLFDACQFLNGGMNRKLFDKHYNIFAKKRVNHKQFTFLHFKEWSTEQLDQFHGIAASHMKLYGYDVS